MVSIVRIETLGNQMVLRADDGHGYVAQPTGHGVWRLPPINVGSNPDTGSGGTGGSEPPTGGGEGDLPTAPATLTVGGVTFNQVQLNHARDILTVCKGIAAANNKTVMRVVLITAIVESVLFMYSNVRVYPETANYPHDRDASDADSVGLFQQRPVSGWGTPRECMDTAYSVKAFLGGSGGPNGGSPRGLFDITGWEQLTPGQAAQKVQVSAFPTRYDKVVPAADGLIGYFIK